MSATAVLTIVGGIGSAVQAVGQFAQSRSQAAVMEHNARIAERDAQQVQLNAAEEERRTRRDNAQRLGLARARRGASGVAEEGSPLEVLVDEASSAELRALDARYGGLMQSRFLQQQAALSRAGAAQTRTAGMFGSVGTLLQGGLNAGRSLLGGGRTLGAGSTSGGQRIVGARQAASTS